MGSSSERALLTSVLDLDAGAPASEIVDRALRALVEVTHARFGRAEVHAVGERRPLVLATSMARADDEQESPQLGSARTDVLVEVLETGTMTVRLELRSRRSDLALTFRDRHLFALMAEEHARHAPSNGSCAVLRTLLESNEQRR